MATYGESTLNWVRDCHRIPDHIPDEQIDRYIKAKEQKHAGEA